MNSIKIQISGLSEGIHRYSFRLSPEDVDLSGSFEDVVTVEAALDKTATQMLLTASISATGKFVCDRCVAEFRRAVAPGYTMVYVPEGMDKRHLDATEVQVIQAGQHLIDIAEDVRQTLLLAIPFKLLCRESCKGLCPHCGTNLNEGTCSCSDQPVDYRWDELRKLQSN